MHYTHLWIINQKEFAAPPSSVFELKCSPYFLCAFAFEKKGDSIFIKFEAHGTPSIY